MSNFFLCDVCGHKKLDGPTISEVDCAADGLRDKIVVMDMDCRPFYDICLNYIPSDAIEVEVDDEIPFVTVMDGEEFDVHTTCPACGEEVYFDISHIIDRVHKEPPFCKCGRQIEIGMPQRLNQETGEWEQL